MRRVIVFLLLIALIVAVAYFYTFRRELPEGSEITLFGNVDVRQVQIAFRVNGRVSELFFEEGDPVESGALMAILDQQPYMDQVRQARANVASIKASLSNADILLNRRQELIQDGSISQEDLDNSMASKVVFEANHKSAQAALAIARVNLGFTRTYAPAAGTILSRIREPGSIVNPGDAVYTLSVTSPVWIRAFIPEPLLGIVYPGMTAEIHTDSGNEPYKGHVGFISPVAEFTPKTVETMQLRTDLVYRLRIYADNPDRGLRQGMPVTVKLVASKPEMQEKLSRTAL
jgi:HlyD family secretion protein